MLKGQAALAACVSLLLLCQAADNQPSTEDYVRTKYPNIFGKSAIRRLIEDNGMLYENHTVITEDGWILNLNRILDPARKASNRGYPILLVNGYFMHSEAWLVQSRIDSNIAIQMSKQGYDVWLGDQRGTMRSKRHVNLTENDPEFWDYSFHESGLYDTASFIDYIIEKTGYKDVMFSCMSLGCAFHAVLVSVRPEYNEKIRGAIYFVPLVNNILKISDMGVAMFTFFKSHLIFLGTYEKIGGRDVAPNMGLVRKEAYHICKSGEGIAKLSTLLMYGPYIHVPEKGLCSAALLSVGGTNVKSTKHVLQVYESGDFAQFDYGREENKRRYGTELPPLYDMSKIKSFLAIYYSDKDMFASAKGVQKTLKSVGGPTYSCLMPNFHHLDVGIGTTFHYVLPDVISLMGAITKNNTSKLQSGKCPSLEWIRYKKN